MARQLPSLRLLTYRTWQNMVRRCHQEDRRDYPRYGGRGVTVCLRWRESLENFIADMGLRPTRVAQIDRIDNERGYEPGNCRWVTVRENCRNRRCATFVEFEGSRQRVSDLAERFNVDLSALHHRLYGGWSIERALTTAGVAPYRPRSGRRRGLIERRNARGASLLRLCVKESA